MPIIDNLEDAKRLRDRMKSANEQTVSRINEWRSVRDRQMDDVLNSVKAILPERSAALFIPVQSQEPDDEIQARKHVLASNEAEIEVLLRAKNPRYIRLAQDFQDALEALNEALFPIELQLDECDGFLGDGRTIIALDYMGVGPELAKYGDRASLQAAAEAYAVRGGGIADPEEAGEDAAEEKAETPAQESAEESAEPADYADEDDSPEATYARAYVDAGMDHEKAYAAVTAEAMTLDGLRYRLRVLDTTTFADFQDIDGISTGMEDGEIDIHPALDALEQYGVEKRGTQLVLTRDGTPTDDSAVGTDIAPLAAQGVLTITEGASRVRYTQIRTREQIVIIVDLPGNATRDGEGIFITQDTPLDDHTGYFEIEGDTKLRAADRRCQPVALGLFETHQRGNMLKSAALAMSIEEATRDVYQPTAVAGAQPVDPTQELKAQPVVNGQVAPEVPALARVETTGIEIDKLIEMLDQETNRYRMHEFFAGSGDSGETGIHLARLQTAYQLRLQPYQTKRARARKEVLQAVVKAGLKSGLSIYIPFLPKESRGVDEGIRVAEPRIITPEMAQLPADMRVVIGAESEETKYAAMQMSQTATGFGTWSMTQHMLNCGVKDPHAMEAQILEDNIVRDAVGTTEAPGWMMGFARQQTEQALTTLIQSLLPRPPVAAPGAADQAAAETPGAGGQPATASPNGNGPAYVAPPTQMLAGPAGPAPAMSGVGGAPV